MLSALPIFIAAALAEIGGCFAFWAVTRLHAPAYWLIPGVAALIAFAWLLTLIDIPHAGRAYAVYGGIYIVTSLGWLYTVERTIPDRWDLIGAAICLVGAATILAAPRSG